MQILGKFTVLPVPPERIGRLGDIAFNLWWTWMPRARMMFRDMDRGLWDRVQDSPVALLREIPQERLDALAADPDFLELYDSVIADFDAYMSGAAPDREGGHVAYFCAEYGWHESIPVYSGGLGILAGDHTKSASDLGVPLVGIGLWYPQGYFHQRVAEDGSQEAVYRVNSPADLPFLPVRDEDGNDLTVTVSIHGRPVRLRAWKVQVGRVDVYLLDSDVPENDPEARALLQRLYGGDQRIRIAQEAILGIGGVRMLRRLGIRADAWHMNEGHSAFMVLERARELVAAGHGFGAAREAVAANTLFTVHTPVAAGNDAFDFGLVHDCLSGLPGELGLTPDEFNTLAADDQGWGQVFSMPALALRFSSGRNGVSALHGETSRGLWSHLWPEQRKADVPIGHVTNGVHRGTWLALGVQQLLDRHLPAGWRRRQLQTDEWNALLRVPDQELWEMRQALKKQSLRFLRRRLARQLERQRAGSGRVRRAAELFDPQALTIGFARRFAIYKRATLIFSDLDRLDRLLNNPERPVQLVFAGKAHPADQPGQDLIRRIEGLSRDARFEDRLLFVEDYDMAVGRALTRGVDVWLNNPRRPLEASGTSGEKAAMNGVLNLSVLDGWWPEGYDGLNGWAFGWTRPYSQDETERIDRNDAEELLELLEDEVVPLFYERDGQGIPRGWLERSRRAIRSTVPRFSAQRMVADYDRLHYVPLAERGRLLAADGLKGAAALAAWRADVAGWWPGVRMTGGIAGEGSLDRELTALARVSGLPAEGAEVRVQLLYAAEGGLAGRGAVSVELERDGADGQDALFRASFVPTLSGRLDYALRIEAVHGLLATVADGGFIRWAGSA